MIKVEGWYQPNSDCIITSIIKEEEKEEYISAIFNEFGIRMTDESNNCEIVLGSNIVKNSIFKFTTIKE
jgi:hypothetical protein